MRSPSRKVKAKPSPRGERNRLRDCGLLGALENTCRRPLTLEESREADFDHRLRSIWPYMIRRAKSFIRTLYRQEKISTDLEDTLVELWIVLRERDGSYPKDRPYLCWAKSVIDNTLSRLRETSRTISSPKDTAYRIHGYIHQKETGNLSPISQQTWADIERSIRGTYGEKAKPGKHAETALAEIADSQSAHDLPRDNQNEASKALATAIRNALDLREATVLGMAGGLWGHERSKDHEIARIMSLDVAIVRSIKAEAYGKIRDYLAEVRHPIRASILGEEFSGKSPRQRAM